MIICVYMYTCYIYTHIYSRKQNQDVGDDDHNDGVTVTMILMIIN